MKVTSWLFFMIIFTIGIASSISVCVDNEPPSSPMGLSINGGSGNLLISWEEVIDSPSCSGIFEYIISRDGVEIGRVDGNVLNFIDNSTISEGEYFYTVSAVDLVDKNAGSSIKNEIIINHVGRRSGGSRASSYKCEVNWSCGEWSECIEGKQMRICVDVDKCGTNYLKSETTRGCKTEEVDSRMSSANIIPKEDGKVGFSTITGAVIGAVSTPQGVAVLIFTSLIFISFLITYIKKRKN